MTNPSATDRVLSEVLAERARQDAKWGEQNHPDGTGHYPETINADVARMARQGAAEGGYLDWLHILREETAEAFAESAPAKLRTELVQVAAVAVAWIEAIDRRAAADETVHAFPPQGSGLTPCCGRTPFELPPTDCMTAIPSLVTCTATKTQQDTAGTFTPDPPIGCLTTRIPAEPKEQ